MSKDDASSQVTGEGARARSRRGVLAGAAGAMGFVAAETLSVATPAQAANGDPVLQGNDNGPTTSRTQVYTTNNSEVASLADPNTSGKGSLGVYGHGRQFGVLADAAGGVGVQGTGGGAFPGVVGIGGSVNGIGVLANGSGDGDGVQGAGGTGTGRGVFGRGGASNGTGVAGQGSGDGAGVSGLGGPANGTGVQGSAFGTGTGVFGSGGSTGGTGVAGEGGQQDGTGVYATGGTSNGIGVWANGQGTGDGVLGQAFDGHAVHGKALAAGGVGVLAENTFGGTALQATGRAVFSRSGVLTISVGSSTATKTGITLTASSLILATLQQNRAGIFVQAAVPNVSASSFTIHLNKTVPANTKVAWFVVN